MRTSAEYVENLRAMKPNVRMGGETVRRDDPRIVPGVNVMRITYDAANDPELEDLFTTTCPESGRRISRFCALCRSSDDLLKKQQMIRAGARLSGFCIQRCMGMDTVNAVSVATKD